MFQPRSVIKAIPLRGWADQPDHPQPIPDLKAGATAKIQMNDYMSIMIKILKGVRQGDVLNMHRSPISNINKDATIKKKDI